MMRQFANESDGVREQQLRAALEIDRARRWIECREQTVFDEDVRAAQTFHQRRFAGVRITDERCAIFVRATLTLCRTTRRNDVEFLAQIADPMTNESTVCFDLRFTG